MESWYEIAIKASSQEIEELLAPFQEEVLFLDRDLNIAPESLGERLRGLLGADAHHWVFAAEPIARKIAAAVRQRDGVELEGLRKVNDASFRVKVRAFSAEVRAEIRRTLLVPRPGITAVEFAESGEHRPGDQGVELYSPAHEFVWQGEGEIRGAPPAIFEVYREASRRDFIEPEPLHLDAQAISLDTL